ncbi:hypothetical protein [Lactobacillus crispatus]
MVVTIKDIAIKANVYTTSFSMLSKMSKEGIESAFKIKDEIKKLGYKTKK